MSEAYLIHSTEAQKNLNSWNNKPILRKIYSSFYKRILNELKPDNSGKIVELGSGIGNLKSFVPECITTDLFPNPWIDQIENAYELSFEDNSINALILFDVWHHLKYPGTALKEFNRVLVENGRLIIFDPDISILGFIIYGLFHKEPVNYFRNIEWKAPDDADLSNLEYYAAQGNASRVFTKKEFTAKLKGWRIRKIKRISSISYVGSGGYSRKQFYPDRLYGFFCMIDKACDFLPSVFSTRLLIVLEKMNIKYPE
jgi:SAM-dependent methyltransferase